MTSDDDDRLVRTLTRWVGLLNALMRTFVLALLIGILVGMLGACWVRP